MFSPFEDDHLKLDKDIADFVENHVDSFIKWDILVLFYNNPGLSDTSSGIARNLGRKEQDTQEALNELTRSKVLYECDYREGRPIFCIDEAKLDIVGKFVSSLVSRETRLAILSKILRREGENK